MAARRAGVPLTVVGDGPERARSSARPATASSSSAGAPTRRFATCIESSIATILPGEEDFGIVPRRSAGVRPAGRGARPRRRARNGDRRRDRRARRRADRGVARRRPARARPRHRGTRARSARTPSASAASGSSARCSTSSTRRMAAPPGHAMVRRHNRLLVAFHVVTDAAARHGRVLPRLPPALRDRPDRDHPKGHPPLEQYLNVLPFIALIVPLGFHLQGLYRLRRGRSRIDDFFDVLVGSILAVVLRHRRDAVLPGVLRRRTQRKRSAPIEVSQRRLGHLPRRQHRARLPVAQARARSARAALGCRASACAGS